MAKKNKNQTSVQEYVDKRIEIVKEFAEKMGYNYYIEEYNAIVLHGWNPCGLKDGELCKMIQLTSGPTDGEGEYYSWVWSLETGKEY